MKNLIYFLLKNTFGKAKYFRFYEILHNISLIGLNYRNVDITRNGELYLMQEVRKHYNHSHAILFDVGANCGNYSEKLNDVFKGQCSIFAFEPYSRIYSELMVLAKKNPNIKPHPVGLGDSVGKREFYSDPVSNELGGLAKRDFSKVNIYLDDKEIVDIDTLDHFCLTNNINRIDFLKIDLEGFEVEVLTGGKRLLSENKIGVIQFEFGSGNLGSKTYLYDFFQLLSPQYKMYKLMRDGLHDIKEYHADYEIHVLCYYVAVNRNVNFPKS